MILFIFTLVKRMNIFIYEQSDFTKVYQTNQKFA